LSSKETGRYVCAVVPEEESREVEQFQHWVGKLHRIKTEIK